MCGYPYSSKTVWDFSQAELSASLSQSLVYDVSECMSMKFMLHDELFRVARIANNVAEAEQIKAVSIVEKKLQKKMHMKNDKIHQGKNIIKGQWTADEDRYMKFSYVLAFHLCFNFFMKKVIKVFSRNNL